jgi:surface protein
LFAILLAPKTAFAAGEFITTWQTTDPGEAITIPTTGDGYNYDIDWGDSSSDTGVTGNAMHVYGAVGTHTITISGTFPRIYLNNGPDATKIRSVEQWGTGTWTSMQSAFSGASNLVVNDVVAPDLSQVTDMSYMFAGASLLNQDLSNWDVSHVTNMFGLFSGATTFNQPLNTWVVSSSTNMVGMFYGASAFNQPLSSWDVSNVTDMGSMFHDAFVFNQDISAWHVSHVYGMNAMFYRAFAFNQSLNTWDVSHVDNMAVMFGSATHFNQSLNLWNVTGVSTMQNMFSGATTFNQDISAWDVSHVLNMSGMFSSATAFNQPLNAWHVASTTNMSLMFYNSGFNQPLNLWDTSSVTTMEAMFHSTAFNQDISAWNVSHVTNMNAMFVNNVVYNQPMDAWVVTSATNMGNMFSGASTFNQPLGSWDVSHVTEMGTMFYHAAAFDQNLGIWDVSNVTNMEAMFTGVTLSTVNYNALLAGWSLRTLQPSVIFNAGNSVYTTSASRRAHIISTYGWTITDGGRLSEPFVTKWLTTSPGETITIPTTGSGYSYDIDWGDGSSDTAVSGGISHVYATAATQTIQIIGTFPRIYFHRGAEASKIWSVEHWGSIAWDTMNDAFAGASHLVINATDTPDLSGVESLAGMFAYAASMNQDISTWDVSHVTNLEAMFYHAETFNQPLNTWDVSHVTNMNSLFGHAYAFNQPLGGWDTSRVQNMYGVFMNAYAFNQPLNTWVTASATTMGDMFNHANSFNQPLGSWDVSSVTTMTGMFNAGSAFNQPINTWDVSHVTNFALMFYAAPFNQPLNLWQTASATNMSYMFASNPFFNQNINAWDVSGVTNMTGMFQSASAFNQSLNSWHVSHVAGMSHMFDRATLFNQDISSWNVSSVTDMSAMFAVAAAFNQDISGWDVSNVTDMNSMFVYATTFNQSLNAWGTKTSSVTDMSHMFDGATLFNQDISSWDVSSVANMSYMFAAAVAFEQNIGSWDVSSATNMDRMFLGVTLSTSNYNALLAGWSLRALQTGVIFDAGDSVYTTSTARRSNIIGTYEWTITDGGPGSSHTVTYTSAGHGSISGSSTQMVFDGVDASVVYAIPAEGYFFTSWSDASTDNPRIDIHVLTDLTFSATFRAVPVVSSSGGGGGGSGALTWGGVDHGSVVTFANTLPISSPSSSLPGSSVSTLPVAAVVSSTSMVTPDAPVSLPTHASSPLPIRSFLNEDARVFQVTLSLEDEQRLQQFIDIGTSATTTALGSGERRSLVRDVFDTIGRAIPTSDLERLARGETAPGSRNLAREKAQLPRAQATFRTLYRRDPNFKNPQENLAWNTLMYRIRFTRDLAREAQGIQFFRKAFPTKIPTDPFQWAVVRVLGYVKY